MMIHKRTLRLSLVGLALLSAQSPTYAGPIVQVSAGAESSLFVDGLDISDGKPAINLSADLSFDNGAFAGLDCYKTETLFFRDGIDAGCNYYLGYFKPHNNSQAFSATVSRGEYAPTPALQWDYTTAALSWHKNRATIFTLSATDDWFGRGYSSVSLNASYQHTLGEQWSANIEAGHIDFGSRAPVDSAVHARLGFRFEQGRWTSEVNLNLQDYDLDPLTLRDSDQPDFSLRFIYRLY